MLVDGRKIAGQIAEDIKGSLLGLPKLRLLVIQAGDDPATVSFIKMKKAFADKVGIEVVVERFAESVSTQELVSRVQEANLDKSISGTIVQLPLPSGIQTKKVLDTIIPAKDPDLLSTAAKASFATGQSPILPPVVAAIEQILLRSYVDVATLDTVVVGYGPLVGEPATIWLKNMDVDYGLVTSETVDKTKVIKSAELLITGAGDPAFIKPEMVREGVVVVDAGTSEQGGVVKGDCDPGCAEKAALMTPVPGGVGPVAVAMLFKNLLSLAKLIRVE
jgi:methylenetetrahydrofolate dehydrogenase (NADP+) / methenyltetrahydrofolate cyclohydrolase